MGMLTRIMVMSILLAGMGWAVVIHNEAVDGDFSDDYLVPTQLMFGLGANEVIGRLDGASSDMDLFTVTVPEGMFLTSIRVMAFTGGVNGSFMGAQPGEVLSNDPIDYIRAGNGEVVQVEPINYVLFGEVDAETQRDVMPQLVVGLPMAGQSPLPGGKYAFWLNETRTAANYHVSFDVVPEPGVCGLLAIGMAGWVVRRRRQA